MDETLDLRGLKCPLPALMAKKALAKLAPGTALVVLADDPMAVVDAETRVIGVDGLRVVDSSIMPQVTTGNLNAPSIMIGEKASDHILGRAPMAPSNQPFYAAADWQTSQR